MCLQNHNVEEDCAKTACFLAAFKCFFTLLLIYAEFMFDEHLLKFNHCVIKLFVRVECTFFPTLKIVASVVKFSYLTDIIQLSQPNKNEMLSCNNIKIYTIDEP